MYYVIYRTFISLFEALEFLEGLLHLKASCKLYDMTDASMDPLSLSILCRLQAFYENDSNKNDIMLIVIKIFIMISIIIIIIIIMIEIIIRIIIMKIILTISIIIIITMLLLTELIIMITFHSLGSSVQFSGVGWSRKAQEDNTSNFKGTGHSDFLGVT